MPDKGMLFVYSGPSGVGKGTLLGPYLQQNQNAVLSVSMTTRAPRPGERDGVEYFFVSRGQFEEAIARDGLLEYCRYSGNYYGTPREAVEKQLRAGRDVILEIEVQGAMQIKRSFPQAVFIFVLPPSLEVLRSRLTGRGTEDADVVETRMRTALQELHSCREYDYFIINSDAVRAREQLAAIITAAKCAGPAMEPFLENFLESEGCIG